MKRSALYFVAAALWGIPGVIITVKGVNAYLSMPLRELWWLMSGTAVALKFIPGIPLEFTASFYSGLGPMLLFASARFLRHKQ